MSDETIARPADGSDPHAAHRRTLPPGTPRFIGRYEVLRILGGGTFGRVYLAFDPDIERHVAIKLPILPPESRREFLREARIVAQLHHPNICPVYDVGTQDDVPFIVMRYVGGGTLDDLLGRGLLAPDRALRITGQIAKGLEAAHTRGVFHRDLKPANVLFDEEADEMLLTDFGIARWLESSSQATNSVKGTPAFMAPEQWGPGGDFGDISARTDVYSLGVILFRMLTGFSLFDGHTYQLMTQHCSTPPRRPSEVRPDLDPRLDDLCLKAVAKQPAERYQSAKEFASAIAAHLRPPVSTSVVPVARRPGETVEFPLPQGLRMVFCWIPPGTAMLGSPESEEYRADIEPEHEYTSQGFWLGKYPVTQSEWQAVMGNNPSCFQVGEGRPHNVQRLDTSRFPIEMVSWEDCQEFLKKLNAWGGIERVFGKVGMFALPHEDMWEYACRGGLGNQQPFFFGKELNGTQANCIGDEPYGTTEKGPDLKRPTPVGSYESKFPHPWGLCDMHGNVMEWCENSFDLDEKPNNRAMRGGSWSHITDACRAAARDLEAPDCRNDFIGFRVCFRLDSSAQLQS